MHQFVDYGGVTILTGWQLWSGVFGNVSKRLVSKGRLQSNTMIMLETLDWKRHDQPLFSFAPTLSLLLDTRVLNPLTFIEDRTTLVSLQCWFNNIKTRITADIIFLFVT